MMKLSKGLLSLLFIAVVAGSTYAQSVESILEKHFDAVGQTALNTKKSVVIDGKFIYETFGLELPMKMYRARPNKIRIEGTFQNQSFVQAFDGNDGWVVAPWLGSTTPQNLDAATLSQIRDQADIDGLLYNYKDKGYSLSYEGTATVDGSSTYRLKLSKSDGTLVYFYISTSDYLIVKQTYEVTTGGQSMSTEILMSDYRTVGGVTWPFNWVTKMNGQRVAQIIFENLNYDEPLNQDMFNRPEGE